MNILAIIPARSGSKGIPDKNIRCFGGSPLLAHTVTAAAGSKYINRLVLSTNSDYYAEIGSAAGAEIPFLRPEDLSSDTASSESALFHALEWLRENDDYVPDLVVFLQCTSPLTLTKDIDGCIERLITEGADTALSVTPSHAFLWRATPEGAQGINHDSKIRLRRQDMEPEYRETGAVYVMKTSGFLQSRHRFFGKTVFHVVSPERSLEIDSELDWQLCEKLFFYQRRNLKASLLPSHPRALVFDFDGVFTDNRVWVSEAGTESVACNRSDGLRIPVLRSTFPGIEILILSKEVNPVVIKRAQKLGIPVLHGVDDKVTVLSAWLDERNLRWEDIVYTGNDLNDLDCIKRAGCGVAVQDAYDDVKNSADLILSCHGGHGAVRELIDLVITLKTNPPII